MSDRWIPEHDALNKAFDTGSILTASRKELERHLVTTCETKILADSNQARNERRASTIRHLLQVRIGEELQRRSYRLSVAAFIVSLVALGFTGWRVWQESRQRQPSPAATIAPSTRSLP